MSLKLIRETLKGGTALVTIAGARMAVIRRDREANERAERARAEAEASKIVDEKARLTYIAETSGFTRVAAKIEDAAREKLGVTGRISNHEPEMQELTPRRAENGGVQSELANVDYSSIEQRILAQGYPTRGPGY